MTIGRPSIPVIRYSEMTPEQQREYHTKKERESKKRRATKKVICEVGSLAEFWQHNRDAAGPDKLAPLYEKAELASDQLRWTQNGFAYSPSDESFVGLVEGCKDLEAFVKKTGIIREYSFDYAEINRQEPWAFWRDFWMSGETVELLKKDSSIPTRTYAMYGIATSIFEHTWRRFQTVVESHFATAMTDGGYHRANEADECWVCRYEKLWGPYQEPQLVVEVSPPVVVELVPLSAFEQRMAELKAERRKEMLG